MRATVLVVAVAALMSLGAANDPAGSWLSYAQFVASGRITQVNASWTVPANPTRSFGSNAPGWWYGIQTAEGSVCSRGAKGEKSSHPDGLPASDSLIGNGALVQPILAWGYQGDVWSIFNGVFDWTDGSW